MKRIFKIMVNSDIETKGLSISTIILSIISLIFVIFILGCSDDVNLKDGYITDFNDGTINLEFIIPEEEHIVTREGNSVDPENRIDNLIIFIFDISGNIMQREDLTRDKIIQLDEISNIYSHSFTYKLTLKPFVKRLENYKIHALANTETDKGDLIADFIENSTKKLNDLELVSSQSYKNKNGAFIMSGIMKEGNIIELNRSASKISVKDESYDNNFELLGYEVYYTAEQCYLTAPTGKNKFYPLSDSHKENKIKSIELTNGDPKRYFCYVNPTKTYKEDNLTATVYVVIEAEYNEEICYYALPIYDNKEKEFYDIEPNHWYDMRITDVSAPGAKSAEDAIKNHNFNQISVEIHDHAPQILSMVSDGIHELGVTRSVTLTENNSTQKFIVKCYSADDDTFNIEDLEIQVIEGGDWIFFDKNNFTPLKDFNNSYNNDKDNPGTQLEFTVSVKERLPLYSDQEGVIEVSYRGLKREINVYYDAAFKLNEICEVTLFINYPDDGNFCKQDYWKFISGQGTSTDINDSNGKLFGIQPEDLVDGRIRNQGLHFPMPYGTEAPNRTWSYKYEINFKKLQHDFSNIVKVTPTIHGDSFFNSIICTLDNKSYDYNKIILELEETARQSYDYAIGSITLKLEFYNDSTDPINVTFDLYHTGFFHYDHELEGYVSTEDKGYYYYEVIPVEENGKIYHWLDRNIGAKSNKMFVDDKSESGLGDKRAAGRYFTIAKQLKLYDENLDYSDFLQIACPPGYHIPVTSNWDAIRLSHRFNSSNETAENGTGYISNFYQSSKGKIYFPKARYYNEGGTTEPIPKFRNESNTGDSNSGYYWTQTIAPGMEKENMGKWLRALYINGTSTSYMNANIEEFKMPVRCVAEVEEDKQQEQYISFNVHNVTHVYLFDYISGASLYPFPGKAVSSDSSSASWQYFACTTTADLTNMRMIFTHMDNSGRVTIFSKQDEKFTTDNTLPQILANGDLSWSVLPLEDITENGKITQKGSRGKYYDFCDEALLRESGNVTFDRPSEGCSAPAHDDGNTDEENPKAPVENMFNKGDKITFHWPRDYYYDGWSQRERIIVFKWISEGNLPILTIPSDHKDWGGWYGELGSYDSDTGLMSYEIQALGLGINDFPPEGLNGLSVRLIHRENDEDTHDFTAINFDIIYRDNKFEVRNYSLIDDSEPDIASNRKYLPEGGSVTKAKRSDGNYDWEITLFVDDGKGQKPNEGGDQDEEVEPVYGEFKAGDIINFYWPFSYNGIERRNIFFWHKYNEMYNRMLEQPDNYTVKESNEFDSLTRYYSISKLDSSTLGVNSIDNFTVWISSTNQCSPDTYYNPDLVFEIKPGGDDQRLIIVPVHPKDNDLSGGNIKKTETDGKTIWDIVLFTN